MESIEAFVLDLKRRRLLESWLWIAVPERRLPAGAREVMERVIVGVLG